jgi:sporulation-control protein
MFKNLLASLGIGAATVDTHVFNESVAVGDVLEGEVHIIGGDTAQDIDDIYLKVATEYKRESDDSSYYEECVMVNYRLSERFTIQAKEKVVVPFSLQLPYEMPMSLGKTPVYVRTGLDIKTAINPRDKDTLKVLPHPLMETVMEGIKNLGFKFYQAECEYNNRFAGKYPFVQVLEFRPTGKYSAYLDELEVIFCLSPDKLEVLLEIDKRARGLGGWMSEALDIDERRIRFYLTQSDLEKTDVEAMIDDIIQSNLR